MTEWLGLHNVSQIKYLTCTSQCFQCIQYNTDNELHYFVYTTLFTKYIVTVVDMQELLIVPAVFTLQSEYYWNLEETKKMTKETQINGKCIKYTWHSVFKNNY